MVGHNLMNPSARRTVFPTDARERRRYVDHVRGASCSDESRTACGAVVAQLIEAGAIDARAVDRDDPLGFVTSHRDVKSLIEAAYRFCRHEPGAHVILTGTGSVEHLRENVDAILAPPLPAKLLADLERIFGNVDSVSGD